MTEMLQKSENVAKNVANENSQDLTEQWRKGELPEGWYYVIKTGDVEMLEYCCDCFLAGDVPLIDNEVTGVLAPVPSYEEWKALNGNMDSVMQTNQALCKKLAELKEYERIVTSYNMKPIDYDIACETVNKLLDERKVLKEENETLKEALKDCQEKILLMDYDSIKIEILQKINEVLDA